MNLYFQLPSRRRFNLSWPVQKPIIAAIDGAGADVIKEAKAGITCQPENPDALARAVLRLRSMTKKEREFLGNNGRTYFELHFERENLIDRLEQWLNELKHHRQKAVG